MSKSKPKPKPKPKPPRAQLIYVEWTDACSEEKSLPAKQIVPLIDLQTSGIFVKEDDVSVTLSRDFVPDEEVYRDFMSIPKVNITFMRKLYVR